MNLKNFRINKSMADEIINRIEPYMKSPTHISALETEDKFLSALRFFASGSYQLDIGHNRNIDLSQASVSRSINEIIDVFHISELDSLRQEFFNIYGFPGVIGCVDCTHVVIFPPNKNDLLYPEHIYVNRKQYHSINVQLISDANLKILSVNAKYPGSTHDSFIWNNSNVLPAMMQIDEKYPGCYYLLGDSGYALRPWMITPILGTDLTDPEISLNDCQMSTRSTVERLNGLLKIRFRCLLKHRVLHYHPVVASKIINSCCAIHNMCVDNNLEDDFEITDEYLYDGIFNDVQPDLPSTRQSNPLLIRGRLFRDRIVRFFT